MVCFNRYTERDIGLCQCVVCVSVWVGGHGGLSEGEGQ